MATARKGSTKAKPTRGRRDQRSAPRADAAEGTPGNTKVMIYVPAEVHRGIAQIALDTGCSKSMLYVEAARTLLKSHRWRVAPATAEVEDQGDPGLEAALDGLATSVAAQGDAVSMLADRLTATELGHAELAGVIAKLGETVSALATRLEPADPTRDASDRSTPPASPPAPAPGARRKSSAGDLPDVETPATKRERNRARKAGVSDAKPEPQAEMVGKEEQAQGAILEILRSAGDAGLDGTALYDTLLSRGLSRWTADKAKPVLKKNGQIIRGEDGQWRLGPGKGVEVAELPRRRRNSVGPK